MRLFYPLKNYYHSLEYFADSQVRKLLPKVSPYF